VTKTGIAGKFGRWKMEYRAQSIDGVAGRHRVELRGQSCKVARQRQQERPLSSRSSRSLILSSSTYSTATEHLLGISPVDDVICLPSFDPLGTLVLTSFRTRAAGNGRSG